MQIYPNTENKPPHIPGGIVDYLFNGAIVFIWSPIGYPGASLSARYPSQRYTWVYDPHIGPNGIVDIGYRGKGPHSPPLGKYWHR